MVDFSTPEAALERLAECVKTKTPAVICTTGFSDAQKAEIAAAAKKIPVVFSSNMSVGVNLLFKRVPEIAKTLGATYDIDIVETHHRFKKDAPSGTAKTLAERIESATGRKPNVHAVRSGDVVGEHRIIFGTLGDSIEIIHRASTRDIFAKGSIAAAQWAAKAKPGLYTMLDVIE
jgi:4-hydroxy-tetrahydrodipicolinate reductase